MPKLRPSKAVPRTERPQIPDYGISKSKSGLLPWKWAVKNLAESREYWIVTVRPDARPHAMIIWGLWFDGAFWFGTGSNTQKARNLAKNPNCIVGTQNAAEAVILEGVAELVTDAAIRKKLEPISIRKYGMSGGDGSEPVYRVRPRRVFGLIEKSFPKTATRWTFDLNGDGKVVDALADPAHHVAEDPINAKAFGGRGEPIQFALISDDDNLRAFTEVIPFPMEESAGPCRLSVIETGPYYFGVLIRVTGFQPGEDFSIEQRSENEGGESKGKADAEGAYNAALFPFVKGKRSGKVRFAVTGKSCKIGIELPWGEGSYQYQ